MPVIDAVASEYQDRITFLAVAGRSSLEASRTRVGDWFDPSRILWGYSDDLWALYAIPGQPASVLISGDDVIVGGWFGAVGEEALRAELDRLAAIG
ncbi:MAG: hypothetical protein QY307_02075 [Acidimicrobiia bacterium]|nr:MAG: hypothetical protein QY307_02075 [Acidimicrobiia bacterium]